MKILRMVIVAASVALLVLAPLDGIQAQEANVNEKAASQAGGDMSPALHLTRQQAIEEVFSDVPAIVVAREQVVEARAGSSIATAISD